jgi:hypothetical protein
MTSVLAIDDHPIVLKGRRHALEDAGVQRVLEARDLVSGYLLSQNQQQRYRRSSMGGVPGNGGKSMRRWSDGI